MSIASSFLGWLAARVVLCSMAKRFGWLQIGAGFTSVVMLTTALYSFKMTLLGAVYASFNIIFAAYIFNYQHTHKEWIPRVIDSLRSAATIVSDMPSLRWVAGVSVAVRLLVLTLTGGMLFAVAWQPPLSLMEGGIIRSIAEAA